MKAYQKLVVPIVLAIIAVAASLVAQEPNGPATNKPLRIRVGSAVALARMENGPLPKYPQQAIEKQIEGTVVLHVIVDADGAVKQEEATSGPAELRDSAVDAVKQWHFGKTLLNNQPLEVDTTISLIYTLRPSPTVSVDKSLRTTPAADSQLPPNKGVIDGRTYKNSSIGLQFTPAPGLSLADMDPAASHAIGIQAQTAPGSTYGLTVFTADELAHYPEDERNAAKYMQKMVSTNEGIGFQTTGGQPSARISGIQFVRTDFVRGMVHETVLVTTHNGYALVFIFAGASVERTGELIASTDLKFSP